MGEKRKSAETLIISSLTWVQLNQRHIKPLRSSASSRFRIFAWSVTHIRHFRSILFSLSLRRSDESSILSLEVQMNTMGWQCSNAPACKELSVLIYHSPPASTAHVPSLNSYISTFIRYSPLERQASTMLSFKSHPSFNP